MSISLTLSFFIGEIICIFLLSRLALQKSYLVLKKIVKSDKVILFFVSLLYFPGTVIHELSHYIAALLLNLHPREMQLFPVITGRSVRLGHVLYEKHPDDFIRSILVGIAPFMGGLISLWIIIQTKLFPGSAWWQTLLFGYLILTITANMFSSKQDLVDVGYLIPFGFLLAFILYLFPLQIAPDLIIRFQPHVTYFIQTIQSPLLFSLGMHAILVILLFIVELYL
jgi:hypothetical protein